MACQVFWREKAVKSGFLACDWVGLGRNVRRARRILRDGSLWWDCVVDGLPALFGTAPQVNPIVGQDVVHQKRNLPKMFALVIRADRQDRSRLAYGRCGSLQSVRFSAFDIHFDEGGRLGIREVVDAPAFNGYAAPR